MENTETQTTTTMEEENGNTAPEQDSSKKYTEEEVLALVSKEVDKAKKQQEKKFQKQMSLSGLDGVERERAEKDNRIAELEQQLAEFTIEKNKSELKSTLASRGLDAQFADLLSIGEDTEENQKLISAFDKLFKKAVNAEVEKRISGTSAKTSTKVDTGAMTVEKFNKMTLREQQTYLNSNPEFKTTLGY